MHVLGVYVSDQQGANKNIFWQKILEYAEVHNQENVLISGDFNSCTKEDSSNGTEYYAAELRKLEEIGFNDFGNVILKINPIDTPGFIIPEKVSDWIMLLFLKNYVKV